LGAQDEHRLLVAEHHDLTGVFHRTEPAPIHLFDEGIAPVIPFDIPQGAPDHLAIAHQPRAEHIGQKGFG
jgi:hypothetical protein